MDAYWVGALKSDCGVIWLCLKWKEMEGSIGSDSGFWNRQRIHRHHTLATASFNCPVKQVLSLVDLIQSFGWGLGWDFKDVPFENWIRFGSYDSLFDLTSAPNLERFEHWMTQAGLIRLNLKIVDLPNLLYVAHHIVDSAIRLCNCRLNSWLIEVFHVVVVVVDEV